MIVIHHLAYMVGLVETVSEGLIVSVQRITLVASVN